MPLLDKIIICPHPLPIDTGAGFTRLAATIRGCPVGSGTLWYEFETARAPAKFPDLADSYLLALLFPAMRHSLPVHVDGKVSRGLLENLERFMIIWERWRPDTYRAVPLTAAEEIDGPPVNDEGIILFSGGLDSCFALLKHHRGLLGRRSRKISRAVLVHGADFRTEGDPRAGDATGHARSLTESLGIELCVVRSNFREFKANWENAHGACLVSCLHWFSDSGGYGLLASSAAIPNLGVIWGTHPLTDHLLGSRRFRVDYDTLTDMRVDKSEIVASWPEARKHLRICYSNTPGELNCRRCRKCLLTTLGFLACRQEVETLDRTVPAMRVFRLWDMPSWAEAEIVPMFALARKHGVHRTPPFLALRVVLFFNKHLYHRRKRPKAKSRTREFRLPR